MPSIAAYVRSDAVNSVVYMGNDLHIHEVALVPGHDWRAYDLTENAGAGLVGGDLAAYVRSDGVNAVLYSSLASSSPKVIPNYLYEVSWKVGDKQWSARNLSQDAGVPAAWFPTNAVGFARSDGWNTVIFLTEGDQGFFIIGELALAPGAAHWTAGSLEGSSNVTGIGACYYRNSGRTAVYVGSLADADETPHIFQSPIPPFAGRLDRDLNLAVPAAVLPFRIAKPACYVRSDGVTAVVYGGIDQDSIHELVYLPGGWQVAGFSHGAAGIGLALLRLHAAAPDARFREAGKAGFAYERALLSPEACNWEDLRDHVESKDRFVMASWCCGAPGVALSRIGALRLVAGEELETPLRSDLDFGLRYLAGGDIGNSGTVCCGEMGRSEILLEAARFLGRPELEVQARQRASCVVAGLLPAEERPFVPGFFQGSAGIGFGLLRLIAPERLPSILLWE